METTTFSRRPFEVDAVQVTEENIHEVAAWCGGKVQHVARKGTVEPYIKVQTHRPLNEKQTMAFLGDWILKAETGFKVYTNQAMENSFQKKAKHRNVFEENRAEAHDAVDAVHDAVTEILEAEDPKELTPEEALLKNIFEEPSGPESAHKFSKFLEEE